MKLTTTCGICAHIDQMPREGAVDGELSDRLTIVAECAQGHKVEVAISNPRFEVFFDIGCRVLDDGYFFEAVATFTASIEQLYLFFTRVFMISQDKETLAYGEATRKALKQSERRF